MYKFKININKYVYFEQKICNGGGVVKVNLKEKKSKRLVKMDVHKIDFAENHISVIKGMKILHF